jgi:hypothetical protein
MSAFWLNGLLWTARIQAAHKIFKLWAVQGLNFFSFAVETSAPKCQTGPDFFTCLLLQAARSPPFLLAHPPPVSLPIFPVALFLFLFDGSLKLERSPFNFQTTIYLIVFGTY